MTTSQRRSASAGPGSVPRVGRTTSGYVNPASLTAIAAFADGLKRRLADLVRPVPGDTVLDVGCGLGHDVVALAAGMGGRGRVVGVDLDAAFVAAGAASARDASVDGLARFVRGDGRRLPFASGVFDVCRCERVLQHVAEAGVFIGELVRVVKPYGTVVVADSDWGSLSIDTDDDRLERRVIASVARHFANGHAGRQLPRWLRRAGLQNVCVEVVPLQWRSLELFRATSFMSAGIQDAMLDSGGVSRDEWAAFEQALVDRESCHEFFASAAVVVATGVKG